MNPPDQEFLISFAEACRVGLVRFATLHPLAGFFRFPQGWCADASHLVGRLLKQRIGCDGIVALGERYVDGNLTSTHAWLEVGGFIIDITHDQFPGTGIECWVLPLSSEWHRAFDTVWRVKVEPAESEAYRADAYQCMVNALEEMRSA